MVPSVIVDHNQCVCVFVCVWSVFVFMFMFVMYVSAVCLQTHSSIQTPYSLNKSCVSPLLSLCTPVNTPPSVYTGVHTHTHTEILQVLTVLAGDIFSNKFPMRPQSTSRGPTQTYDNKLPPVCASKGKSGAAQPSLIISQRKQPWQSKNNMANRNDFHFITKNRNQRELHKALRGCSHSDIRSFKCPKQKKSISVDDGFKLPS